MPANMLRLFLSLDCNGLLLYKSLVVTPNSLNLSVLEVNLSFNLFRFHLEGVSGGFIATSAGMTVLCLNILDKKLGRLSFVCSGLDDTSATPTAANSPRKPLSVSGPAASFFGQVPR